VDEPYSGMDEPYSSSSDSTSPSEYGVGMGVTMEDVETMKQRAKVRGLMVQDLLASNVILRWANLRALRAALRIRKFLIIKFPKEVVSMIIRYLLPAHMIVIEIQDDVKTVIEID